LFTTTGFEQPVRASVAISAGMIRLANILRSNQFCVRGKDH
jgi:hypothetical protein